MYICRHAYYKRRIYVASAQRIAIGPHNL